LDAEQAEQRYHELYAGFIQGHDYSKPIVQKQIRTQTWTALLAEIEREVIAKTLLPAIEQDAACQAKP
jgi:hypothetical protein